MNETVKIDPLSNSVPESAQRLPDDINFRESGPHLIAAGALTGTRVVNRQDETLGSVSDVVLDVEQGSIAYVVMASGGFMGIGERLFALPWKALTRNVEGRCFVVDAGKTAFEKAPGFDQQRWPESPFPH